MQKQSRQNAYAEDLSGFHYENLENNVEEPADLYQVSRLMDSSGDEDFMSSSAEISIEKKPETARTISQRVTTSQSYEMDFDLDEPNEDETATAYYSSRAESIVARKLAGVTYAPKPVFKEEVFIINGRKFIDVTHYFTESQADWRTLDDSNPYNHKL